MLSLRTKLAMSWNTYKIEGYRLIQSIENLKPLQYGAENQWFSEFLMLLMHDVVNSTSKCTKGVNYTAPQKHESTLLHMY